MDKLRIKGKLIKPLNVVENDLYQEQAEIELERIDGGTCSPFAITLRAYHLGDYIGTYAIATPVETAEEKKYPCAKCGLMRTKEEGGTTFTLCDKCWDEEFPKHKPQEKKELTISQKLEGLMYKAGDNIPQVESIEYRFNNLINLLVAHFSKESDKRR